MPRASRIVVPNVSHHVTQRGNNQQAVFFVDGDKRVYLDLLQSQSARYGFGEIRGLAQAKTASGGRRRAGTRFRRV